jgi:hypothetical protein
MSAFGGKADIGRYARVVAPGNLFTFAGNPGVMHLHGFAIDRDEVGAQSRRNSTKLRVESKEFGWM